MRDALIKAILADPRDDLSVLALADWCEDQGLDGEAAFWRWVAAEGVEPYRLGSDVGRMWYDHPRGRPGVHPASDVGVALFRRLPFGVGVVGRNGTDDGFLWHTRAGPAAAYLALRDAWLATPAAERPSVREVVA